MPSSSETRTPGLTSYCTGCDLWYAHTTKTVTLSNNKHKGQGYCTECFPRHQDSKRANELSANISSLTAYLHVPDIWNTAVASNECLTELKLLFPLIKDALSEGDELAEQGGTRDYCLAADLEYE